MPRLTNETFLALRQSCRGFTDLAKYLINYCGFKYVLLGKIQSDTIEGRFGRIRQLSGANYYISMRQLLETDRKLRTLSLVKYSRISISHIDQVAKSTKNVENEVIAKAESLYGDLQFNILPTDNDVVVIFYVTGYCCKSLVSRNKCAECKDATIAGISEATDDIPDSANQFIKEIDRGGLWKPKSEVFLFWVSLLENFCRIF